LLHDETTPMKRTKIIWFVIIALIIALVGYMAITSKSNNSSSKDGLQIVAAENFWGNIASQIGGDKVHVISVVSDPNADPHEFATSTNTARDFAHAKYVILNGVGYDSWGDALIKAQPENNRTVLKIADAVGKKEGDNPHLWYSPAYVQQAAEHMAADMSKLDPAHASTYKNNLDTFKKTWADYQGQLAAIKKNYAATKIAATEDIFEYTAAAAGFDVISPRSFMQAVAESNDPPTESIAGFQKQLQNKEPALLVYNQQTSTPLTESLKKLATDNDIPVVGITETMPEGAPSFQDWMNTQLTAIQRYISKEDHSNQ